MRTCKNIITSGTHWSAVRFLMIVFAFLSMAGVQAQQLTYGSTIRLRHSATGRYLTGLNQKYNNTGSSGQWAIACTTQSDQNTHWVVENGIDDQNKAKALTNGQKVNAGDSVTFRNVGLNYRLHSHTIVSPASRQGEVSGFELGWGPNKQGDQNDNFQFVFNPVLGSAVSIKHIGTGHYLHSHDVYKYGGKLCLFDNDEYQEVTTYSGVDANNDWLIEVVQLALPPQVAVSQNQAPAPQAVAAQVVETPSSIPSELIEGTIVALQSNVKGPGAGKFIGVDATNHLVPTGNVGQIPTDIKCHFKILRYKNWIGFQSLSTGKNIRSAPGSFEVAAVTTNFAQDTATWEQFSFYGDMNSASFKNNITGGFLSVRTADGPLSTADHTGGPAKNDVWEQFKIHVIPIAAPAVVPEVAPVAAPVVVKPVLASVDRTEIDAEYKKIADLEAALKIAQDEKALLELEKFAVQNVAMQAQNALIKAQKATPMASGTVGAVVSDVKPITQAAQSEPAEKQTVTSVVASSVAAPIVSSAVGGVVSQVKPTTQAAQSKPVQKQPVTSVTPNEAETGKAAVVKKAAKAAKKPAGKKAAGKKAAKANKRATNKKQDLQIASGIVSPVSSSVTSEVTQNVGVTSPQDSTASAKVQPVAVKTEQIKAPEVLTATVVPVPTPKVSVAQQKKVQTPKKASKKQAKKKKNKGQQGIDKTMLKENQSVSNSISPDESAGIDALQPTNETAVTTGTIPPPPPPMPSDFSSGKISISSKSTASAVQQPIVQSKSPEQITQQGFIASALQEKFKNANQVE